MKKIRQELKRIFSRQGEAGYALTWVLILSMVAGFVLAPFLTFMLTGTRASYSYADTMAEFYAADSGIEDGIHKIAYEYEVTTNLDGNLNPGEYTIKVTGNSTALFPERGVITIGTELIYYTSKDDSNFYIDPAAGGMRDYPNDTNGDTHNSGAAVTAGLPDNVAVGDTWEYGIEDINGNLVDISIETTWTLEGLEDDKNGTAPHQEFVTVGQMLDTTSVALTIEIEESDTLEGAPGDIITVSSTTSFPAASDEDPSVIRIDDELFQYTGKTATTFTGVTREFNDTTAADHAVNTAVTSEEITYKIDITITEKDMKLDRIGAWLPPGFEYVPGTSNLGSELDTLISNSTTTIGVEDVSHFATDPDLGYGVVAIEHELIKYTGINSGQDELTGCTRGYAGTTAVGHSGGTPVTAEPSFQSHHGSTAIIWHFTNVPFEDLPREASLLPGAETPDEFPTVRTVTFSFTPGGQPTGVFSWARSNSDDIYLSWDLSGGTFKITSTATDPETGTHTSLESYVGAKQLTDRTTQVQGDARAIGNSLIRGNPVSRDDHSPDWESTAYIDSDHDNEIPDGASVETAYLYWAGWRKYPQYAGTTEELAPYVNQAMFNGTEITADRVQTDPVDVSGILGWMFSCRADVTDLLEPPQSADITISPTTGTTESVTIYDEGWGDLDVRISADSGNPGNMVAVDEDGSTVVEIAPGQQRGFTPDNPQTIQLSSGSAEGDYNATITVIGNGDVGRVDGDGVDNVYIYYNPPWWASNHVDVTLSTGASGPPQAIITKTEGTRATVNITNNTPNDPDEDVNDVTVDGVTLEAGETDDFGPYLNDNPHTILGTAEQYYNLTLTCIEGTIKVEYNNGTTIFLGEPGSQMTNGEYTVGVVPGNEFVSNEDLGTEASHAAWSLIIIYSHPDEEAHQLFLYDDLTFVSNYANNFPGGYLEFPITGFIAPEDFTGTLTCFIGEGDPHYDGDYIEVNGYRLPRTGSPYDDPYDDPNGLNPQDDVWNGVSSVPGIGGSGEGEGIDIDAFWIQEPIISEGNTAATLKMDTGVDGFSIIYLFLSFKTVPSEDVGSTPVAINTFSFAGQ